MYVRTSEKTLIVYKEFLLNCQSFKYFYTVKKLPKTPIQILGKRKYTKLKTRYTVVTLYFKPKRDYRQVFKHFSSVHKLVYNIHKQYV